MQREDLIALTITLVLHLLLGIFAMWYMLPAKEQQRAAFIEVTLGEFKSGSRSKRAPVQQQEVKSRKNPGDAEVEQKQNEVPTEVEAIEESKPVKAADLPDANVAQSEDSQQKVDSEEIDPTVKSAPETKEQQAVREKAEEADKDADGAVISGNVAGTGKKTEVDEGPGNETDKSAPYELEWEGDIQRNALVQPLPRLTENFNAVVRVRFEVKADG